MWERWSIHTSQNSSFRCYSNCRFSSKKWLLFLRSMWKICEEHGEKLSLSNRSLSLQPFYHVQSVTKETETSSAKSSLNPVRKADSKTKLKTLQTLIWQRWPQCFGKTHSRLNRLIVIYSPLLWICCFLNAYQVYDWLRTRNQLHSI